jgi:hypothetical protein
LNYEIIVIIHPSPVKIVIVVSIIINSASCKAIKFWFAKPSDSRIRADLARFGKNAAIHSPVSRGNPVKTDVEQTWAWEAREVGTRPSSRSSRNAGTSRARRTEYWVKRATGSYDFGELSLYLCIRFSLGLQIFLCNINDLVRATLIASRRCRSPARCMPSGTPHAS